MIDQVFGLSIEELREIKKKLLVLGIELKDLVEFLDRDKSQLFAELKNEIKVLKSRIENAKNTLEGKHDA